MVFIKKYTLLWYNTMWGDGVMKIEPFKLERFFAKYEFSAPYLLSSSDCESFTVDELLEFEPGAHEGFRKLWLGYTESSGNPGLKREISGLYENIYPNEVLVHAGAEEAIFIFMNTVLRPGDHIIVHYPCYQSLTGIARSIGCEVTLWEAKESENWELHLGFLEESIRNNTKAVVINCPHNPTGYTMDAGKFHGIVEIAAKHGITVFSDEVYRYLEYDEKDRLPAACDIYDNAVSLGVMSKAFGLAGLRIGWVATRSRKILDEMAAFKDYTSICNSAPGEYLSIIALRNRDRILKRNLDIIRSNLMTLDSFFEKYRFMFNRVRPKAGSIAFPSLKPDIDIEKFCTDLVESKGVLLLPASCYSFSGRNFRLGYGRKNMPESLSRFEEYIRETYMKRRIR